MDSQISNHTYQPALEWLYSQLPMFSRVGAPAYKPGLQTTETLDLIFGHPHRNFRAVHIGGTNGKGSTSHMLAAVLQAQGYKTGLYTSPHLTDFRERMRINGGMIPKDSVVDFINRWRKISPNYPDLHPSFFELTMMMAFDWFSKEDVDIVVVEVGMGGRLDSTNIITPLLSVITNISFDHTQFLGNTLEAIAVEKAGIIKPGVPVVIGEAAGPVKDVFINKAKVTGSPIIFSEENEDIKDLSAVEGGWRVVDRNGNDFRVPLAGDYQIKNIRTVATAISRLRETGVELSDEAVANGLSHADSLTGLRGRWQRVNDKPVVICDTGHNVAGLKESLLSLRRRYGSRRLRFVIGFVNDKDVSHIVDLFPEDADYYFAQASVPRALPSGEVRNLFETRGLRGKSYPNVETAYRAALNDASDNDVVYVGGSTFIVADLLASRFPEQSA